MRKISYCFVLAIVVLGLFVSVTNQVFAVTQVDVCPAGFICTPVNQVPVDCPVGYVCVPNPVYTKPIVNSSSTNACYRFTKNLGELDGAPGYESTGADVVALQSQLISLGYDIPSVSSGGSARGQFDDDTRYAVMKYQASKGIPSTGFVGPLTRASLNASCSNSASTIQTWIPNAEPYISVIGPNGNEKINLGQKVKITWKSNKIDKIETIQIKDVNEGRQSALQAYTIASNISNTGSFEWTVPYDLFDQKNLFSNSTRIGGRNFKIYVKGYCSTCSTVGTTFSEAGYYSATDMSDESFTISSNTSPSPTPTSNIPVISRINPVEYSKYGQEITLYGNNLDGTTNIEFFHPNGGIAGGLFPNSVSADKVTFTLSGLFIENSGYNTYLVGVVTNKCKGGCDSNRVTLRYSNSASPSPTPTYTPAQPSVSFIYPTVAETWYQGQTKYVSWSYNNFSANVSGDRFVELQLIPQDGRDPVVLGTYTAPYGYQPLTIYAKTSTGRDAWLPGTYKLRLVCRSSNVDGYRNCKDEVIGLITVKAPTPSPTTTPVSMDSNAQLNASIWSAIEEYNRGR